MLTLDQASKICDAALNKAQDIGVLMNVAVVDHGGNLLFFARQPGAWLGSIDIAINKAHTARWFDMPSQDLAPMAQSGQPLFGIHTSNQGKVVVFAGGIPLQQGDEIVGAVGVSGGTVDQDQEVAEAGVAAL